MASISQIRGALFEEAVLFLLEKVGYQTIEADPSLLPNVTGLRGGRSGLDVRGRGTWHQIDALASFIHSPAFMYPLRLTVEAKCYQRHRPVGVEVARNAVGVLKDISENYFTVSGGRIADVQVPCYNYHSAIFSTSGYTSGAIEYALAHQIFLIQYENVPVIRPLIDAIMRLDESCVTQRGRLSVSDVRRIYRYALQNKDYEINANSYLTEEGINLIEESMVRLVRRIAGSYFGMLQGRWPMHLLTERPLPPRAFETDKVSCRVVGYNTDEWKFIPLGSNPNSDSWFELQFDLPSDVAVLVSSNWGDRVAVANMKQEYFSYINLSGIIGGIQRNIRLELDRTWIQEYIERSRRT